VRLQEQIQEILSQNAARIGVAIRHIESGAEVMIGADEPVPLASVVKVPALVEAFRQIGAGQICLDDRWSLTSKVKTVGSGVLYLLDDGLALSVRDILLLMITISDNTATDMLLNRLGVASIDACMRNIGLPGISVKHTIRQIFDDMLPTGDPNQDLTELERWETEHGVKRGGFSYSTGPENNVGTPRDLARLMEMIFRAELLDQEACRAMLDIMHKQQITGRFPRYLPAGTRVANKTGSFSGVRNDVGILYVNDQSHVAFALLSTWDADAVRGNPQEFHRAVGALDDTFGKIGLAVYHAFGGPS